MRLCIIVLTHVVNVYPDFEACFLQPVSYFKRRMFVSKRVTDEHVLVLLVSASYCRLQAYITHVDHKDHTSR